MEKFDYLIVGAGLFGSTIAHELKKQGRRVLVIEKDNHIGGAIYSENVDGINVHRYGAHIFHTDDEKIWNYVNQFATFNDFVNMPIANFHGEKYHLPFNMNTFAAIWPDVKTAEDAQKHINEEIEKFDIKEPKNLEEQAIKLVGETIYRKLVKEYTEKQWGKDCKELPPFIIKRLPVRFEYNNNYFNDKYQGIPVGGYTQIIEKMLNGIEVRLNTNFLDKKDYWMSVADKIIYTGPIDEFYDFKFGYLEYRSLKFVEKRLNIKDYQGNAVVNYTSHDVPYTRIIEHKHFENSDTDFTIIYEEYPQNWVKGMQPFYSVNDEKNNALYSKYLEYSSKDENVIFGGRLGHYKYYDMDDAIIAALKMVESLN